MRRLTCIENQNKQEIRDSYGRHTPRLARAQTARNHSTERPEQSAGTQRGNGQEWAVDEATSTNGAEEAGDAEYSPSS